MSKLDSYVRGLMVDAGFPLAAESIKFNECNISLKQMAKVWEDYLGCKASAKPFRYIDPELKMYDA